jgi:hypothetical protein
VRISFGERSREAARRASSRDSVFLPAIAGTDEDDKRVVVRPDVHSRALEQATNVLRAYLAERRKRQ